MHWICKTRLTFLPLLCVRGLKPTVDANGGDRSSSRRGLSIRPPRATASQLEAPTTLSGQLLSARSMIRALGPINILLLYLWLNVFSLKLGYPGMKGWLVVRPVQEVW